MRNREELVGKKEEGKRRENDDKERRMRESG